jgi:O-antigen ligase
MKPDVSSVNEKILVFGIPIVTLLVWTISTLDPVNLPKMVALVTIAFASLPWTLALLKQSHKRKPSIFIALQGFSIIWILAATFQSDTNPLDSFFGVSGRYNGAVSYVSFILIAICVSLIGSENTYAKLLKGLVFAGVVNLIYNAVVIFTKTDPIPWVNRYGTILGTFGNPNFISSFLGIFNIIMFSFFFKSKIGMKKRAILLTFFLVSFFEILSSKSLQGVIVSCIGCGAVILYRVSKAELNFGIKIFGLVAYFTSGILAVIGMLQIGPLAGIVYKTSVSIRGAYWRAGWETMLQNPIIGIGPDSFGDWYTRARDSRAMLLPGPDVFTNSPHNIFIEQGVNGGIPLFLIYLLTQIYIFSCGIRYLKNSSTYSYLFAGSFFGWIGFTAQSLISINQIGLAIWGYVLGGMTVGIYLHSKQVVSASKISSIKSTAKSSEFANLFAFAGATLGLVLSLPPFYADTKWRDALESKNLEKVIAAANQWPQSTDRYIQVSKALYENKFYPQTLDFVRKGIAFNPNNSRLWYYLFQLPESTQEEKDLARARLSILDPNFKVQ